MNPLLKLRLIGVAIAFSIYGVDQYVKWLMVEPLQLRQRGVIDLLPFFDLRWTQNFGVSMGLFEADSIEARWILVGVTALILGLRMMPGHPLRHRRCHTLLLFSRH